MSSPNQDPARERHWVCAQRLRTRRLALGLTQSEVTARLRRRGLPTTNRGLSAMENGRGVDLGVLPDLAAALDCTVTYLLGLTTDPYAWHPGELPSTAQPPWRAVIVPAPDHNGAAVLDPQVVPRSARARRTHWRDPGSGP